MARSLLGGCARAHRRRADPGVIATGTISAADLLVGPLAGEPLSALVELLESDGAYVNVHTNDGMGDVNTGPGDFPGGEIRGQIEHHGH
jgi:hypothetical protein